MSPTRKAPFAFKAFLSHRYKSPETNLYFFDLFSRVAEVQFEVDEGTFSTSVTRLERLIRDADAFIGIYPFAGTWEEAQSPAELRQATRYFRLELDLAIRSGKPAVIFYDQRFRDLLRCPATIEAQTFDAAEVGTPGGSPRAAAYERAFRRFCEIVRKSMAFRDIQEPKTRGSVCVAVPPSPMYASGYEPDHIQTIRDVLTQHGYDDVRLVPWPPVLARDAYILFQETDWAIIDVGTDASLAGLAAFLHGRFLPMVRLKHVDVASNARTPTERMLFDGVEVGYNKDVVVWNDPTTLRDELTNRIVSLEAAVRRINTASEATHYFRSAALRRETIFLSYSGVDQDLAADIAAALGRRFQKVFDYRSRGAIEPGQPWVQQIFDQLSASAVGVPLLSPDYLKSGNCMHELQQMAALRDRGSMRLFPVKLHKERLDMPTYLDSLQYLRFGDYESADDAVREISRLVT